MVNTIIIESVRGIFWNRIVDFKRVKIVSKVGKIIMIGRSIIFTAINIIFEALNRTALEN